jgi:hypothetical protein
MLSEDLKKGKKIHSGWDLSNVPESTKYHIYLKNTNAILKIWNRFYRQSIGSLIANDYVKWQQESSKK